MWPIPLFSRDVYVGTHRHFAAETFPKVTEQPRCEYDRKEQKLRLHRESRAEEDQLRGRNITRVKYRSRWKCVGGRSAMSNYRGNPMLALENAA